VARVTGSSVSVAQRLACGSVRFAWHVGMCAVPVVGQLLCSHGSQTFDCTIYIRFLQCCATGLPVLCCRTASAVLQDCSAVLQDCSAVLQDCSAVLQDYSALLQ
jgi:hypothetical protein